MREILFRGKAKAIAGCPYNNGKSDGEWVFGYIFPDLGAMKIRQFESDRPECNDYEVDPETVGQYTGLTDNNNRKIFEGDIVKCTDTINDFEFNAVVEFGNPNGEYNWGYQLKFISGEESNFDILCWVDMEETGAYIEVIGNIHDNPELLKGGEGDGII